MKASRCVSVSPLWRRYQRRVLESRRTSDGRTLGPRAVSAESYDELNAPNVRCACGVLARVAVPVEGWQCPRCQVAR